MLVIALSTLFVSGALAQTRTASTTVSDKYVISAKAGSVNYVEGGVTVIRPNGKGGLVLKRDQIEIGDRVSTAADGRLEVLLNPGSYLRLGGDSTFDFRTTSLDDLQVNLVSGSAMLEVFATNEFKVTVFTPQGNVVIAESGVYRIDIARDGATTLAVTEGEAEIGTPPTLVREGRTANISTGNVAVTKFDRGERDELAEWSRTRAKGLAKMVSSLRNQEMRDTLMGSFNRGRWSLFDRMFGVWVFNPYLGSYCFLPYGWNWSSPYGFGFGPGIYWYNLPPVIRVPPTVAGGRPSAGADDGPMVLRPARAPMVVIDPPSARPPRTDDSVRLWNIPADTTPVRVAPTTPQAPTAPPNVKQPGN